MSFSFVVWSDKEPSAHELEIYFYKKTKEILWRKTVLIYYVEKWQPYLRVLKPQPNMPQNPGWYGVWADVCILKLRNCICRILNSRYYGKELLLSPTEISRFPRHVQIKASPLFELFHYFYPITFCNYSR